jgi:hypothetical protein
VRQVANLKSCAPKQRHKYNYSGLEVTLLDYTLSRASQGDVTIFRDLEKDPELFKESKLLQHQMYQRYVKSSLSCARHTEQIKNANLGLLQVTWLIASIL